MPFYQNVTDLGKRNTVVLLICDFAFYSFIYPWSTTVLKHMIPLVTYHQMVNSNPMLHHMPMSVTLLHLIVLVFYHLMSS